jgi:hypothetical protein
VKFGSYFLQNRVHVMCSIYCPDLCMCIPLRFPVLKELLQTNIWCTLAKPCSFFLEATLYFHPRFTTRSDPSVHMVCVVVAEPELKLCIVILNLWCQPHVFWLILNIFVLFFIPKHIVFARNLYRQLITQATMWLHHRNKVECNVMVPFRKNGLVPFLCSLFAGIQYVRMHGVRLAE